MVRQYLQAAGDVTVALLEHCAGRDSPMLLPDEPETKKNRGIQTVKWLILILNK